MEKNIQNTNQDSQASSNLQGPTLQEPNPPQNPSSPIKPASKFSIKVIIGTIIFLLLAGIATASFTVFRPQIEKLVSKLTSTPTIVKTPTPTPDPTANWKTYTPSANQEHDFLTKHDLNFSIKYPPNWYVFEYKGSGGDTPSVVFSSKSIQSENAAYGYPNIDCVGIAFGMYGNDTFNDILNNDYIGKESPTEPPQENISVDGAAGIITHVSEYGYTPPLWVALVKSGVGAFDFRSCPNTDKTTLTKFLSTFKFTDIQPLDTSKWSTFKSDEYKYSIQYPPDVIHTQITETDNPTQKFNLTHDFFKVDGGTLEVYGACGRGIEPIKEQNITIDGQKTEKLYETETSGVIKAIQQPVSKQPICFNFSLPENPDKLSTVDHLFDQILSTLKFTN